MKRILAITLSLISVAALFSGCSNHEHNIQYRTVKEPSCTEDGAEERYCTDCDYVETWAIPAAHKYETTILKESTCQIKGSARYTCSVCGDSYEEETELSSHNYVDKYCTVCGTRKVGTITERGLLQEFDYGSGGTVVTTCKITTLRGEINEYGLMKVYIGGIKTYDWKGDNMDKPCSFMMVVKDARGKILHSEQIMTEHIIVDQSFNFYVQLRDYYDDSEDYTIELSDYMM